MARLRNSGLAAEYAVDQDGALENAIVAGRHNGQMMFRRIVAMRRNPKAGCGMGVIEAGEKCFQVRAAHRQQFAAAAIEHLVGIESLHGIARWRSRQGQFRQVEAVAERVGGKWFWMHAHFICWDRALGSVRQGWFSAAC